MVETKLPKIDQGLNNKWSMKNFMFFNFIVILFSVIAFLFL